MNNLKKIIRQNIFAACLLALVISITGCSKEPVVLPTLSTCTEVSITGTLTMDSAYAFTYHTSGGGIIKVDLQKTIFLKHDNMPAFQYELWSVDLNGVFYGTHENLNGKHIKDRISGKRSFVFPDGAKITIVATDSISPVLAVSIYDGAQAYHFNATCDKLEYSGSSDAIASGLDDQQPDGETAAIEFKSTGLLMVNIYEENTAGNKVMNRVPLGEIFTAQPNRVDDYYP